MEICASGQSLAIGLKGVFLSLQDGEVIADTTENLMFFVFCLFGTGFSLHNDNNQLLFTYHIMIHNTKSFTVANHHNLLIINADDFGYNHRIDTGILELLKTGSISSLSAIVNGSNIVPAAKAIQSLRTTDQQTYFNCSIGLHLNLTEGVPLNPHLINSPLTAEGAFLGKLKFYEVIESADKHLLQEIVEQARLQIISFSKLFERRPSHLDGHNHVHLIPQLAKVLAPLLRQMGIYRVRFLEETLSTINITMNQTFLKNYQTARSYYLAHRIISPKRFVGLESFGKLETEPLMKALEQQKESYRSVELMCHPGYPDKQGNAWVASSDRLSEFEQLRSASFSSLRQTNGIHSYHHLKDNGKRDRPRVLIYSKLVKGCGNQTTALRLEQMLEKMGFEVYLWNIVDCLNVASQAHDLFHFLLNFRISLILGVNATRSGEIIEMATRKMRVPYFLIIAGTDANIAFKDPVAVQRMRRSLELSQCFVSLSQGMTSITREFLASLGIKKEVHTIVQSSCIKKILEEPEQSWVKPTKPYILLPTSFRKVKCVDYLLKQLNYIMKQSDFQVYIVGPIIDRTYFQECMNKLGNIKYLGVLPKSIYARYLLNSFAIINTSESQGMSCSILEAFELEVPVIVRSNQGNLELVKHLHNGLVFQTPEQFVSQFYTLKNQPQLRQHLTANSSSIFKQKYNNEHEVSLYTQLIQQHFMSQLQSFTVNEQMLTILNRTGVHPVSTPNIRLFEQIHHPTSEKISFIDVGCGTGIFGLTFLSQPSISEAKVCLTDIDQSIVASSLYNYQQSTVWDKITEIEGIESDMFQNVGKRQFDVILFNPPQSPFRQPVSRPDKNGGPSAVKFIEPMFEYFSQSHSKCLYQLYSFLAWPAKFKQLLQKHKLKVAWESLQEYHIITAAQYDEMEEGLSGYIMEHLREGKAEISLSGEVFTIPAIMYRIEHQ